MNLFFENTELKELLEKPAANTEEIYLKTIAEKFAFEKKQIVKELQKYDLELRIKNLFCLNHN